MFEFQTIRWNTNEGNPDIKMYINIVDTEVMEKEKPMRNLDNGFSYDLHVGLLLNQEVMIPMIRLQNFLDRVRYALPPVEAKIAVPV